MNYVIDWKKFLGNRWFLIILGIKIIAGSLLGSDFLVKGFIPFVNYFVTAGFDNPYDWFQELGRLDAFPYPPLMLFVLTAARLLFWPVLNNADWQSVTIGHQFMMHLPILAADIVIYLILCKWLETKERTVLWLYWASPVLFCINYVLGQLDALPTAALFISLIFLFNKKPAVASMLLGLGIALKTHLVVVIPFYCMYWLVNQRRLGKPIAWTLIAVVVAAAMIAPFILSDGFRAMAFGTGEGSKAFLVHLPYLHNNLRLLLAPAALVILFLNFLPYKKLNKDAFLLILGLVFTVFILFVPPMPGWYYWSIPFFVYFFAKYQEIPKFSFWCLTGAYLAYVIVSPDSTLLSSWQIVAPDWVPTQTFMTLFEHWGLNGAAVVNSIFTVLIAAVAMNAVWIYRMGVRSNLEYKVHDRPLVIGIGGDSGAGKNTLAVLLSKLFSPRQTLIMEGDDAHKWERHDHHWNDVTHLNPKSNRLYQELQHTATLARGEHIQRQQYDHATGHFSQPQDLEPHKMIIYVGLHPFYLSKMRQMFDLKIYLEPDEALRRFWKIQRDQQDRGRAAADVLKQIEDRTEDSEKYIRPQRAFADIVMTLFPLETLSDQPPVQLGLRLTCDNSLHIDPFMEILSRHHPALEIEHWYDDDLHHQILQCKGIIAAADIQAAAYVLIPNLEELTDYRPEWQADYDGIRQLFVLYYYSEQQKAIT